MDDLLQKEVLKDQTKVNLKRGSTIKHLVRLNIALTNQYKTTSKT